MCKSYVANTFIGPKVVVSVSGKGIEHSAVVKSCEKGLGGLKGASDV